MDTEARTSSRHAFNIELYKENDVEMVRFFIHPIQNNHLEDDPNSNYTEILLFCALVILFSNFSYLE
ncbi:RimK/LysX family protein [Methanococcoides sp. AM1]|uniref:RimK/LysX family protein n=1 Tax=Methanococcoides sp. AM1 TaxID=1201011 RepID=UPI001FCF10B1|nr:RimK/LysX family protein [Methanococcoides sp. AM1]